MVRRRGDVHQLDAVAEHLRAVVELVVGHGDSSARSSKVGLGLDVPGAVLHNGRAHALRNKALARLGQLAHDVLEPGDVRQHGRMTLLSTGGVVLVANSGNHVHGRRRGHGRDRGAQRAPCATPGGSK